MSQPPLFDFDRPVGRPCQKCGYPFSNRDYYPMKSIDCPEHMPAHWKFHERKAYEQALQAQLDDLVENDIDHYIETKKENHEKTHS